MCFHNCGTGTPAPHISTTIARLTGTFPFFPISSDMERNGKKWRDMKRVWEEIDWWLYVCVYSNGRDQPSSLLHPYWLSSIYLVAFAYNVHNNNNKHNNVILSCCLICTFNFLLTSRLLIFFPPLSLVSPLSTSVPHDWNGRRRWNQ